MLSAFVIALNLMIAGFFPKSVSCVGGSDKSALVRFHCGQNVHNVIPFLSYVSTTVKIKCEDNNEIMAIQKWKEKKAHNEHRLIQKTITAAKRVETIIISCIAVGSKNTVLK